MESNQASSHLAIRPATVSTIARSIGNNELVAIPPSTAQSSPEPEEQAAESGCGRILANFCRKIAMAKIGIEMKLGIRVGTRLGRGLAKLAALQVMVSAIAIISFPAETNASVVLAVNLETLAKRADLVVRGTVQSITSSWSKDQTQISTIAKVSVSSTIKGKSPSNVIDVRTPGGTVGDLAQSVSGAAVFNSGEEVILFLKVSGENIYSVDSLALGKFNIFKSPEGTSLVKQDAAAGLSLLQRDGTLSAARGINSVTEREFVERIQKAVASSTSSTSDVSTSSASKATK